MKTRITTYGIYQNIDGKKLKREEHSVKSHAVAALASLRMRGATKLSMKKEVTTGRCPFFN